MLASRRRRPAPGRPALVAHHGRGPSSRRASVPVPRARAPFQRLAARGPAQPRPWPPAPPRQPGLFPGCRRPGWCLPSGHPTQLSILSPVAPCTLADGLGRLPHPADGQPALPPVSPRPSARSAHTAAGGRSLHLAPSARWQRSEKTERSGVPSRRCDNLVRLILFRSAPPPLIWRQRSGRPAMPIGDYRSVRARVTASGVRGPPGCTALRAAINRPRRRHGRQRRAEAR